MKMFNAAFDKNDNGVYVATAYSAFTREEVEENIRLACALGKELYQKGWMPFVPHSMMDKWDTEEYGPAMTYDNIMDVCIYHLKRFPYLCMGKKWLSSRGAQHEIRLWCAQKDERCILFESNGIPKFDEFIEARMEANGEGSSH